jgi:hypothetical protein
MVEFTPEERVALGNVDKLARGVSKADFGIAGINRRILRLKNQRDRLIARKVELDKRLVKAIETIDTSKTGEVIP